MPTAKTRQALDVCVHEYNQIDSGEELENEMLILQCWLI